MKQWETYLCDWIIYEFICTLLLFDGQMEKKMLLKHFYIESKRIVLTEQEWDVWLCRKYSI